MLLMKIIFYVNLNRVIDCFVLSEDSPKCNFYIYIYDIHKLQFYLS